jgi:uncharacterized protein involved in exopolysaccharide biosynthesis
VTAEPTAAFSSDPKERRNSETQPLLYKAAARARSFSRGRLSFKTLADLIKDNLKLLVLGPILAAVVAFAVTSALPKWYTSVAYLAVDEAGARTADARMRSSPVLDKVLSEYNAPRSTLEGRRRFLEDNRRMGVAAGETQRTSNLFRLEYSDKSPQIAQKVNTLFIEAWLESTKPRPDLRSTIEAEIERTDTQAKSISTLIDRLQKDAPSLLAQSLQGELATPILGLITKRDQNLAQLITLKNSLNGITRDVIFGKPDLPEEPSWPRRGMITILAGFLAALLLLIFVLVRRFWPTFNS